MGKEIRADHVAIYIRWSTEDQGEGTTLAVQSDACHHYVRSQGWKVCEALTFIDDGYSGGSLERPAIQRLRAAVQAGLVDCVVVFKLDRLSRSVIDTVNLVLREWDGLTHVKSAREPVDTTSAMGKQFFYMLVSYAEWERNVIRERTFSGKLRRASDGRSPGMPSPYGYQRGDVAGSLRLNPIEVPAVLLAFDLAAQGMAVRSIARRLSMEGYPTRSGRPWAASTMAKLLRNPLYAGQLVWGRRQVNPHYHGAPGEPRLRPAVPHVVRRASTIPSLIEQERFDMVQALLGTRSTVPGRASGSEHFLTGLLRCGWCDRPLQHNASKRWRYYRCPSRSEPGGCSGAALPAEAVEAAVGDALVARAGPLVAARLTDHGEHLRRAALNQWQDRRTTVSAALQRTAQKRALVDGDYLAGRLAASDRNALMAQIGEEESQLLATKATVEATNVQLDRSPRRSWSAADVAASWAGFDAAVRKRLLPFFVAAIHAKRTTSAQITLRLTWRGLPAGSEGPQASPSV